MQRALRDFARLAAFALSLTCIFWVVDDTPRFFFGDSEAYLGTSLQGYLPPDRSWVYGLAVRWIMQETGSLSSVLLTQAILYALAIAAIGSYVVKITKNQGLGYMYCGLTIIDPINFFYVRHILTDTPAASFFLLSVFSVNHVLTARKMYTCLIATLVLLAFQIATVELRIAYIPALLLLSTVLAVLSLFSSLPVGEHLLASRFRFRSACILSSTVVAITTFVVVNGLVNPQIGFALNGESGDRLLSIICPALRYEVLIEQGFQLDRGAFEALELSNLEKRDDQIWRPKGLEKTLYSQMGDLSQEAKKAKIAQLNWAILLNNPVGVIRTMLSELFIYLNPVEYIKRAREGWFVFDATFHNGFIEGFIHPLVWEKINRDLPLKDTFSREYFLATVVVGSVYFIFSILSPIGVLFARARAKAFYILGSVAASGYALSTPLFSPYLAPRFLAPLPGLVLALALTLSQRIPGRESPKLQESA